VAERLLSSDTHVHIANGAFPEFRPKKPEQILRQMQKNALDIMFVTNHDTYNGYQSLIEEAAKLGMEQRIGLGVEITTSLGPQRFPHIIGIGLNDQLKIPTLKSPLYAINWIHDLGGFAIAAHPTHSPTINSLTPQEIIELPFDGIEVTTLSTGYDYLIDQYALEFNLARIGSTDTHENISMLGVVQTVFIGEQPTWQNFIDAAKQRNVHPITKYDLNTFIKSKRIPFFARLFMQLQNLKKSK